MIEAVGLTSTDAMNLLRHTLEQLEAHLDNPDESSLSGQGMLEITRDRLSTLYALVVNLIPAPNDSRFTAACPRCSTCSEPIVWSERRQNWTHRDAPAVPHAVITQQPAAADPGGFGSDALADIAGPPAPGGNVRTWVDTRADDRLWLTGSDPCPRGCPHVIMTHRRDVGCVSCDCQHGISTR